MLRTIQVSDKFFNYAIPVILFIASLIVYSYNLEGQPFHGDEINYLGWAGNYVHLIKNSDFGNPCLISIDNCNLLFHVPAFGTTYSPLRLLFIGIPMVIENQDNGNFYNWSCFWNKCYDPHNAPTPKEMAAGRLFSPFFAASTVVLAFGIGRILFNRYLGVIAALVFLFFDVWIWHARSIMVEVHYLFFCMLTLMLLLYSVKNQQIRLRYLALAGISYGFALMTKLLSVEFSVLFLSIILIGYLRNQNRVLSRKSQALRLGFVIFLFFTISGSTFLLTHPGFYQDPAKQITAMKRDMDNYNRDVWYIGYPTINGIQGFRVVSLLNYILFPSFVNYHVSSPEFKLNDDFGWSNPPTYSSLPLTIFFFIGLWYLVRQIAKRKDCSQEIILLIWFTSTFLFSLLMAKDFRLERYLLPLMISNIFISSYGFWKFIRHIRHNGTKIMFTSCFIFANTTTSLYYWKVMYFAPGPILINPIPYGTLQESLYHLPTLAINMIFLAFFFSIIAYQVWKKFSNIPLRI